MLSSVSEPISLTSNLRVKRSLGEVIVTHFQLSWAWLLCCHYRCSKK